MHPHSFRHYYALEFLRRKNDIALLADLLGHRSIDMTRIYLRQTQTRQQETVDKVVDW
jgi:site-specific recombinase XerD